MTGKDGKKSFISDKSSSESSSALTQIEVECFSPSSILGLIGWDRVDFIKIDTEGHDPFIVESIINSFPVASLPKIILWEKTPKVFPIT